MTTYISFTFTVILFMIVPGPSVSVIVANTLRYNLNAGVKTVIGTVSGAASMFVIYAFGFDLLSKNFQTFLNFIQWIGILFLFYMGFVMIRDSKNLNIKLENKNNKNFYLHGFLVLWSNPKMLVMMASIIPVFLDLNQDTFNQVIILGIIFCTLGLISDLIYAHLVNYIKENFFKKDLSLIGKFSGTCLILGSFWLLSLRL